MWRFPFLFGAFLAATSACSVVSVEEPIGATPLSIEPDEWEGYWSGHTSSNEESIVGSIEVLDPAMGILRAVWLEGDEPQTTTIYLREANGWTFASVPDSDTDFPVGSDTEPPDEPSRYVWARFEKTGDAIFAWLPDVSAFRELVRAGRLPGDAGPPDSSLSSVRLGPLDPEDFVFLVSDEAGIPFGWDEPIVLIRSP